MVSLTKKEYSIACTEVLTILKYISKDNYEKIPKEVIEVLEKTKDTTYYYSIDFSKGFDQQNITETSKAILANFYRDYWATEEERKDIIQKEQYERNKIEEEKNIKYSTDNIFKDKYIQEKKEIEQENRLVKYKEDRKNIFIKIINYLKNIINHVKRN